MEKALQLQKGKTAKQEHISQMIPALLSPKFHPILQKFQLVKTLWDQLVWLPNQVKRTKLISASNFTYEVATPNSCQLINKNKATKSELICLELYCLDVHN